MEKNAKSTESKSRIAPRKYPSGVLRLNALRKDVPASEPSGQNERRSLRHHEKFQPRKRAQAVPTEKATQEPKSGQNGETGVIGHDYQRGPSYPEQQKLEAKRFRLLIVAGGGIALAFVLLALFKSAF